MTTAIDSPPRRARTRRRVGAHLPLGGGMVKAVDRAVEIGANTLQVFSDNPTSWKWRTKLPRELDAFRGRLRGARIAPLTIHASYLINLAGPEDGFYEQSIELMAHELSTARYYGARFVNVHIGSHRGKGVDAGIERLGMGIARVFERLPAMEAADDAEAETAKGRRRRRRDGPDPLLVLENSAGGGGGLGTSVAELARIAEGATRHGAPVERLAFCFDTAHLWSAGHDLRDPEAIDRLFGEFDDRIGIERLVVMHLNDSKAPLGSHQDRHEHIGAGAIGPVGLRNVLTHPLLRHVAFYIETPGMDEGYDAVNMDRVRLLIAGRRLPALPPEAMLVRGSRSRRAGPEHDEEHDPGAERGSG